jgi:hypothetical protein
VGDGGVTVKMLPWYPSLVATRTAAMPPVDRQSVARSARTVQT